jgi:hypothetical protein
MRSFAGFLSLFVVGFAVMAVLAWPVYDWLTPTFDVKFHRVANRLGMLALLIGFLLLARRMGVADRTSLGYGLPRAEFWRVSFFGLLIGVLSLLPIVVLIWVLELRTLKPGLAIDAWLLTEVALNGLLSGVTVALIEETFFRGAMHSGIARESGTLMAIGLTALLYSAVHFMGSYRIPIDELGPDSGWRHITGTLANFAAPQNIVDAFLALFAVGVLLGMIRAYTGHIAACLGLHAGWVWIIAFLREGTTPNTASDWKFLISDFDGVVGWGVFGWTVALGVGLYVWQARRRLMPPVHPQHGG